LPQPTNIIDYVVTRDGRELVLYQRGGVFAIEIDGADLMFSRAHGSEEDLARLALEALGDRPAPRVLVGGLGMGYTLRAVLDGLDAGGGKRSRAVVVVAEAFPEVVSWNRGVLADLARRPLDDRRVRVEEDDVVEVVARARKPFDVILLDVDNGPEALTLDGNRHLYTPTGLARLHDALAPGGVLAVWSATGDPRFVRRLGGAGFAASQHRSYARPGGKGGRHTIFLGRRA